MDIIQKILDSNTTLIGCDSANTLNVDKILSYLPNKTIFDTGYTDDILEYFNSISHSRDYKLSLLNNQKVMFIIIDLSSIYYSSYDDGPANKLTAEKSFYIQRFVTTLQSRLYTLSDDNNIKYKLILLTNLMVTIGASNVSGINNISQVYFAGGNSILYISSLVIKLLGDKMSIEKNREGDADMDKTYSITQVIRDISINNILNENTTTT